MATFSAVANARKALQEALASVDKAIETALEECQRMVQAVGVEDAIPRINFWFLPAGLQVVYVGRYNIKAHKLIVELVESANQEKGADLSTEVLAVIAGGASCDVADVRTTKAILVERLQIVKAKRGQGKGRFYKLFKHIDPTAPAQPRWAPWENDDDEDEDEDALRAAPVGTESDDDDD